MAQKKEAENRFSTSLWWLYRCIQFVNKIAQLIFDNLDFLVLLFDLCIKLPFPWSVQYAKNQKVQSGVQ